MERIILVVDFEGRYLQREHRFKSLDVAYMSEKLSLKYDVEITSMSEFGNNLEKYKECKVIYTGSQMPQYKNYIEDIMYFVDESVEIIPSFEVLKSHENKFFQELYNRKYGIESNIKAKLVGDISEFRLMNEKGEIAYPLVIKGINGSASMNVKIVSNFESAIEAISEIDSLKIEGMISDMPSCFHENFGRENRSNRQLILQECIDIPNYDYRVHIMGDHYWGHKRTLETGKFTSGSGSRNDYLCDIPEAVLEYSKEIFEKIKSPFAILDIIHSDDGSLHLIEWSGLHLGIISLLNGERYYVKENDKWNKIEKKIELRDVEDEFVYSFEKYIEEIVLESGEKVTPIKEDLSVRKII